MAKVIYEIEMNAENAPMIDQVNRLLLGEAYTEEAAPVGKAKPATTPTKTPAKTPAKTETKPEADDDEMSLADFKTAVKKAKADHGEDFCKTVLIANGSVDGPLGRMVTAIDDGDYGVVVTALEAGPIETSAEEDEDDDGFDDEEEDTSKVTVDSVKLAAKAYAKEVGRDEAKEIMTTNGAATLTKIADCSEKQLQAMFKAFTA
jgi:hypothetical protein